MVRKALLLCGILSSLFYVGTDVLGAMRYEGYSTTSQTISELAAVGSPVKPLVDPLFVAYDVLLIAFGLGVWGAAGRKRALRLIAGLLIAIGVIGFAWPFAPMHPREVLAMGGGTLTDTMHIVLANVTVLFILVVIGFGTAAFGKQFRLYSIGTILILLAVGVLVGLDGPRLVANLPTPWLGVMERINVYGYLLWVMVLAIALLRIEDTDH
jgi:hypothetical protein